MSAPVRTGEDLIRFDEAKRRAGEMVRLLPANTPALIASFASNASAATNFTRDRGLLRQTLEATTPTDEPGSLSRAFELIRALAGQSEEGDESPPPRVILFSDGSFEDASAAGGIGRGTLEFVRIGEPGAADNVGIVALAVRRDYEDPSTVRLFVRLQSVVGRELSVPLECRVEDAVVSSSVVRLGAGSPDEPSEAARTIEFLNTEGGLVTVRLGRTDDLASDDAAGLVLRRPAALRIAIVRPNIAADMLDEVVQAALESLGPASLRILNAGEYERASQRGGIDADLIVFDRVRPATLPAAPSISFGATLPIPGLGVSPPPTDAPARPTGLIFWLRSHPVMRFVVLNSVWVASPMRMTLPDPSAAAPGAARLRTDVLASGQDGPLIVAIEQGSVRRILVGFDLGESNWVKDASFHIFLKNAVEHLTLSGEDEAARAYRTTDTLSVRPASGRTSIEISGPVSFARSIGVGEERVSLGPFPAAGVYRIAGVVPEDSIAAINLLNPVESRLEVRDSLDSAGGRIEATRAVSNTTREIWHWFVLAAAALLAVEWMLYALRMKV